MLEKRTTKALIILACSLLLVLAVSPAWAQERVLEGAKQGVQKGAAGVKKGAVTAADKAEDVGQAVGKGVKKGAETVIDKTEDVGEAVGKGVKKGAESAIDKTEDVGEAVGKGVKDVFTDNDRDSDNDEGIAEGVQATEPQQQGRPGVMSSATESDTNIRELPATAGEQPLILLIGALALAATAALTVFRRVPNS